MITVGDPLAGGAARVSVAVAYGAPAHSQAGDGPGQPAPRPDAGAAPPARKCEDGTWRHVVLYELTLPQSFVERLFTLAEADAEYDGALQSAYALGGNTGLLDLAMRGPS